MSGTLIERGVTTIETDRLVLRPYEADDAPRVLDILGRAEVMKWLGGPPMADLDEVTRWISRRREREAADPFDLVRAIEVKQTGVVAGTVMMVRLVRLDNDEFDGDYEIGWHLHPDSVGRGHATEAAGALLDDVFARGLADVWCGMMPDNERSLQVARRLGLPSLGTRSNPWYEGDGPLFHVTRDEWLSR